MDAAPMTLEGQIITLTGTLAHLTRAEAAQCVHDLGGEFSDDLTLKTTDLVVGSLGWPVLKNGELSRKFRKANQWIAEGKCLQIISESAFWKRVGKTEFENEEKSFSIEAVCQTLSLPPETLRRWEQFGLIRSEDGKYDVQDLVSLQTLSQLIAQGIPLSKIRKNLQIVTDSCPEFTRPLAQLKIISDDQELLSFISNNRHMTARGQILFGFDSDTSQVDPITAEQWFDYGAELESERRFPEAIIAYTKAIELDYESPEALFNLANIYRSLGDQFSAERFYQQAVERNPMFAAAWYNLGTLQAQIGRSKAVASLLKATELQPSWIDAHFNLALTLEAFGRSNDAVPHWLKCLELTPPPDMAKAAREHLLARQAATAG